MYCTNFFQVILYYCPLTQYKKCCRNIKYFGSCGGGRTDWQTDWQTDRQTDGPTDIAKCWGFYWILKNFRKLSLVVEAARREQRPRCSTQRSKSPSAPHVLTIARLSMSGMAEEWPRAFVHFEHGTPLVWLSNRSARRRLVSLDNRPRYFWGVNKVSCSIDDILQDNKQRWLWNRLGHLRYFIHLHKKQPNSQQFKQYTIGEVADPPNVGTVIFEFYYIEMAF